MSAQETGKTSVSLSRPTPILMIPLRRCGSHALRLRLNFSPQFYSPYPLHIVDFMPLVPLYGDLADDRRYFQMVVDIIGLQTASMVKWSDMVFEPAVVFEAVKHEPRSVHRIVWELLFQAGMKNHAKVIMDKSLDSVHYAEELITLFEDMRFLNVVRDPRAQISSMNRAIIHDFDTLLNAMTWVAAHTASRSLMTRYPDRVLTIRYEDFLSNQEEGLRRICAFFGMEFLPAMLDVSQSPEAQRISGQSALWESNCYAPIAANVDKFKQFMSLQEIELIETLTGAYMDYYGYERMTRGKADIAPQMVNAAKKASEVLKKTAWSDLATNNYRDYLLRKFRADYLLMVQDRLQRNTARGGVEAALWTVAAPKGARNHPGIRAR